MVFKVKTSKKALFNFFDASMCSEFINDPAIQDKLYAYVLGVIGEELENYFPYRVRYEVRPKYSKKLIRSIRKKYKWKYWERQWKSWEEKEYLEIAELGANHYQEFCNQKKKKVFNSPTSDLKEIIKKWHIRAVLQDIKVERPKFFKKQLAVIEMVGFIIFALGGISLSFFFDINTLPKFFKLVIGLVWLSVSMGLIIYATEKRSQY